MADHPGKKKKRRNSPRDMRSKTMHLTDMKMSLAEAKKESPFDFDDKGKARGSIRQFPHGLKIRLENVALEKLKMNPEDFHLGDLMTIEAHVEVVGIRNEHRVGEEPEMMVKLQITELDLGQEDKKLEDFVFEG